MGKMMRLVDFVILRSDSIIPVIFFRPLGFQRNFGGIVVRAYMLPPGPGTGR